MKFLCVCAGGNVRSQALAYILHDLKSHEAIPVGHLRVSSETMKMMCEWADYIVIMQAYMLDHIDQAYHQKVKCIDVGEDRFGIYIHPELLEMVKQGADWLLNAPNTVGKLGVEPR
jgi:predicted protein tyrosine phosphatase